jgi:hypothetical protein
VGRDSVVQTVYREFLFWDMVREAASGCWEWTGTLRPNGYGLWRQTQAHRQAWEYVNGYIPKGLYVCHKCDNRRCVNPGHLFLGTPLENSLDAKKKGRTNGGKQRGVTHVGKHAQVLAMLEAGKTRKEAAEALGMTDRNVYYIQKKYRDGDEFRREGRDPIKFAEHHRTRRANYDKKRREERAAKRAAKRGLVVPSGADAKV